MQAYKRKMINFMVIGFVIEFFEKSLLPSYYVGAHYRQVKLWYLPYLYQFYYY